MRTYRFNRRMVIVASLALIPWLPVLSANAADQPPGAGTPSQETKLVFTEMLPAMHSHALVVGVVPAQGTWIGEIENSLKNYKATYPTSNFNAYTEKLSKVRIALESGNKEKVRAEMGVLLKMLRTRAQGINEIAADELFIYWVMVTPIAEYRISVPPPAEFGMPG
ncbi:MAG TPA: hypothetical protein VE222_01080, partial [Nitrospiraceae bacterium]|nr:hypothetical protein [Nitrospiraceae bacterium]